jgi:tetratricopeptide (TPR) repeat protein
MAKWRTLPDQSIMLGGPRSLAMILHREHRYEEGVAVKREELAGLQKSLGAENHALVNTLDNLGYQLLDSNRYDEAATVSAEALRQSRKFLPGHEAERGHIFNSLFRVYAHRNDWDGQLKFAREILAISQSQSLADVRYANATLARILMEQAEHFAGSDPGRAAKLLDELTTSKDFEADVKAAGGWVDCLRGMALRADPARHDEAQALLGRGLDALKKKEKPGPEDEKRIKKAETWSASQPTH